ncbi:hypothetical protein QQS45_08455 [Alteriqipengyuania flavescens]|uniref:hypothetical protein n=1 Tax=Alteriqipengyuania flavescens TaxID=3053610 RepID=UPI0025B41F3B|nr:hypothetical protein [Alteriqipengyuania flavescens]WJY17678.1 hypothetical protein QQW98_08450 [Alteriqipengyuania flavescens]WJY23621.1 hypothetical protein QQS45_08455 [Alteriqipengyuania flavescens]
MPTKQFLEERRRQSSASPKTTSRPAPGRTVAASRVRREEVDGFGAFGLGVGDTVTFGFLDEAGAFVDALGGTKGRANVWNSDRPFWDLYDENVEQNRATLSQASDENGGSYLSGQVVGGFVPFLGWGGRTAASARAVKAGGVMGATARGFELGRAGALYGAAYGFGAGDGDFGDRFGSAVVHGATGALGGYVFGAILAPAGRAAIGKGATLFRRGKAVEFEPGALPSRAAVELEDEGIELASARTAREAVKDPAGLDTSVKMGARETTESVTDELPEGALLTARELLGDPGAARAALTKRLGEISPQQAQRLMQKIEQAEATGKVVDDPHYRSLLMLDLGDETLTSEQLVGAAELFEEATEALAAKAGIRTRTLKGMEQEVSAELKRGVTLDDLEDAFEAGKKGYVKTRIAQHVVFTTTAKVIRLREELYPDVVKGVEGARDRLAEELTDAAQRFTLARGILSNAGRTLGMLSHGAKARSVEVMDDLYEAADPEVIRQRVDQSLREMDDTALGELLGKVRTLADADKLEQVLLNPENAKAFSTWTRAVNSVSLFMRSNALTPATGLFNSISMVLHDFFRNDLAKGWAARGLIKAGRADEGLALQLERQAGRSVYWEAHRKGLSALVQRIKWEFWTDVEKIAAVGWGSGKVAQKARMKRSTMLSSGYVPPQLREFRERVRLDVSDADEFNQRIEQQRGDTAFGNIVYHLHRARAVATNTVDALGGASMKLFTGAIDDWGREFIRVKETYSQATRFAVREALEVGVPQEELADYAQRRAMELSELPTADLMARVDAALVAGDDLKGEAAFLADLHGIIQKEADEVLFMDGPQSSLGKASSTFLSKMDRLGVVLPYVKTPIRLFEQGVVNYGPFAEASREVTDVLARGARPGASADEKLAAELMKAKVEVGTTVFNAGLAAGAAGIVVATNGGYENSGNLDAGPPNRLNFPGGGFIEFGRLDPFAFTLGMGAIIGQAFKDGFADGTEYDQQQALQTGLATAFLGAKDVILEKSYLQGLQEITQIFTAKSDAEAGRRIEQVATGAVARFMPMAGIGRQFNETFRSSSVEAVGFMDQILRHIPGAGYGMAPRIDPLGDEVKGRTLGINFGNSELSEGGPMSPVKRQLRDLGIDISTIRKSDPDGFDLTSEELSEVRRVRAKEALNQYGETMHEALEALFADPWFQALPSKDQKRAEVVKTMRAFNKPAWEILSERSPSYAAKRSYTKSLTDYIAEGVAREQAERWAEEDVEAEGLPQPEL